MWVVHCQKQPYDVYIGRPSFWGNPYSHLINSKTPYKVETRLDAIKAFRYMVNSDPDYIKLVKFHLKGKVLGCWCHPKPCHGDVLAQIANGISLQKFY